MFWGEAEGGDSKKGNVAKKFMKTSLERLAHSESFPGRAWGWRAGAMLPSGYSPAWGHEALAPAGLIKVKS